MPILKQLVSHSSQSKRRSRADLTAEMISAPLGDFRHTMHVGRGGDAFGDTSFLSTRSGEAPPPPEPRQDSPGPKPGLLSRTFRSSKRSQSINRGDGYESGPPAPGAPPSYVKNAISMPVLNEDPAHLGQRLPKSASSGPPRRPEAPPQPRPANGGGAVAMATLDPEFDERGFGELGELPPPAARGGGLRPAESIMSFSIDLGPSMLGDILSVMEKKGWDDADLGYEEGGASPPLGPASEEEEGRAPAGPPPREEPYTPEWRAGGRRRSDSCSSSDSAPDEGALAPPLYGDADSARYSAPRGEEEFSFMDDDDDEEIRV